jgi:uncharacterized membrane protein
LELVLVLLNKVSAVVLRHQKTSILLLFKGFCYNLSFWGWVLVRRVKEALSAVISEAHSRRSIFDVSKESRFVK